MAPELPSSARDGGIGHVWAAEARGASYRVKLKYLVLRRWWFLAAGVVLGAALGVFFAAEAPAYEASATVYLTPVFEPSGLMTATGLHLVLNNQTNALAVLHQLGLTRPPQSLDTQTFLREALSIEEVPNGYFFKVKVRLADPELAANAANAIAERGVELMSRLWRDALAAKPAQVEKQFEDARVALAQAERQLLQYKGRIAPSAPARISSPKDELGRLQEEVEIKRLVYIDTGSRVQRARADLATTTPPLRIVDKAIPPAQPVSLPRSRRIALSALAGLIVAACMAVTLETRWLSGRSAANGRI